MMEQMGRFGLAVAVAFCVCVLSAGRAEATLGLGVPPNITIVGMFPLTGALAGGGVEREAAFRMAIEVLNADSSILPQTTVLAEIYDTKTTAGGGISATLAASENDRVVGIVGAASSTVSRAVQQVASVFEIPQVSYSSTSSLLSDKSLFPYFARVVAPDSVLGAATASLLHSIGWRKVVTIRSADDYGLSTISAFNERAFRLGLSVARELLFPAGETDFSSVIDSIVSADARVIFLNCFPSDAITLLRQAIAADLFNGDYVWVGTDGWLLPQVLESGLTNSKLVGVFGLRAAVAPDANLDAFYDEWEVRNASLYAGAGDRSANFYAPYAYDAAFQIAQVAHELIEGGRDVFDGKLFMPQLANSSRVGVTGLVTFDEHFDRVPVYELANYQGGSSFTVVGRWLVEQRLALDSPIRYVGNVTTPPFLPTSAAALSSPSPDISPVALGLIISLVVIVVCVCLVLVALQLRRRRLVAVLEEKNEQLDREARALNSRLDALTGAAPGSNAHGVKLVERLDLPINRIMAVLSKLRAELTDADVAAELDAAIAAIQGGSIFSPNKRDTSLGSDDADLLAFVAGAVVVPKRGLMGSTYLSTAAMGRVAGPTPLAIPAQLGASLSRLRQLTFEADVIAASESEPMTTVFLAAATQSAVLSHLRVPPAAVVSLLSSMSALVPSASARVYHNSMRAVYVVQFVHYLLSVTELYDLLSPIDSFAVLLAAAVKQIDTPEVNNQFLVRTHHPMAILHANASVIEHHQVAVASMLLFRCTALTAALGPEATSELHTRIIDLVLATDMTKHVEITSRFDLLIEPTEPSKRTAWRAAVENDDAFRSLVLKLIVKMAELSDAARPARVAHPLALRQMVEYARLGNAERQAGLPVSPFMDGAIESVARAQEGILKYVILPMATSFSSVFPIPDVVSYLTANLAFWQQAVPASFERQYQALVIDYAANLPADHDFELSFRAAATDDSASTAALPIFGSASHTSLPPFVRSGGDLPASPPGPVHASNKA